MARQFIMIERGDDDETFINDGIVYELAPKGLIDSLHPLLKSVRQGHIELARRDAEKVDQILKI